MPNELYTIDEKGIITTTPVLVGVDSKTDFQVYRRFRILVSDVFEKQQHSITYEQWRVDKNGNVDIDTLKHKSYIVRDVVVLAAFTQWFEQLAPTLIPAINGTLQSMPIDVADGYILKDPQ